MTDERATPRPALSPQSDAQPPLIERLFEQYHHVVFGLCCQIIRNPIEAEDLLQDVFLQALRALPALRDPTQARSWLLQIAHRRCLDHLRRRDHFQWLSLDLGRTEAAGGRWDDVLQTADGDREAVLDVHAALQRLSAKDRLLLVLRDSYELSYDEIAQVTSQNAASARKQAYRARRRFARFYGGTAPRVALDKEG